MGHLGSSFADACICCNSLYRGSRAGCALSSAAAVPSTISRGLMFRPLCPYKLLFSSVSGVILPPARQAALACQLQLQPAMAGQHICMATCSRMGVKMGSPGLACQGLPSSSIQFLTFCTGPGALHTKKHPGCKTSGAPCQKLRSPHQLHKWPASWGWTAHLPGSGPAWHHPTG